MADKARRRTAPGARTWFGALAAAMVLLVLLVGPLAAASTKTRLSGATVSPRNGTPATTIVVTVLYQNANGSRAEVISVSFGGVYKVMSRLPGGSWGKGVTFRWSGTLSAGRHPVSIKAVAKDNSEATLGAGSVTISAPPEATPKPRSTPKPTPKPTSKPTPTPTPTADPTSAPTPGLPGAPLPTPLLPPLPVPTPFGPPADDLGPSGLVPAAPWPASSAEPSDPPVTAVIVDGVGSGGTGGTGAGGGDGSVGPGGGPGDPGPRIGRGPVAGILAMVGIQPGAFPGMSLAPTLVTTTTVVGAAMALGLFGRRRHDDDPPDDMMSAAAANGVAVAAYDAMGEGPAGAPDAVDMEMLMPRWRRPSLIQARKADPIRDATPAPRLTFDEGLVGPLAGTERRVIRYRVVRLLDSPDELRGTEIGYLDQGDEVQLLEKYGAYWLVVAPDGQQGWLHKMTLGDIVDADGGRTAERPTASMPTAAESWTMGEADIDSDVLEAYLESRRRNA